MNDAPALEAQLVESLAIANRLTAFLLDACTDEALAVVPVKGWGLAAQFAHIHNVRLMWLDSAKVASGTVKLETKSATHTAVSLGAALQQSASEIEGLVRSLLRDSKRMPGFKPHTPAFIGYLIAHSAYHHGEIGFIARDSGFPVDKKHAFGLWEWGARFQEIA